MTAVSNTTKNKLNRMNRAAQDASIGTVLQNLQGLTSGSLAVTLAQMSASAVVIYNPQATLGFYMYNVSRSGCPISTTFWEVRSGGSLTLVPPVSGSFLVGDVVNYLIA